MPSHAKSKIFDKEAEKAGISARELKSIVKKVTDSPDTGVLFMSSFDDNAATKDEGYYIVEHPLDEQRETRACTTLHFYSSRLPILYFMNISTKPGWECPWLETSEMLALRAFAMLALGVKSEEEV